MKNMALITVSLLGSSFSYAAQAPEGQGQEEEMVNSFGFFTPSENGLRGMVSTEKISVEQAIKTILQTAINNADQDATEITVPISFGSGNQRCRITFFTLIKEDGIWRTTQNEQ